jgi:O-methyltransferase
MRVIERLAQGTGGRLTRAARCRARRAAGRLARVAAGRRGAGRLSPPDPLLSTASAADRAILECAQQYSMTTPARMLALVDAVRYCLARGIDGALGECGVWLGGSVLAMVLTLQQEGVSDRDVYLYDTFEGMTAPTALDTSPLEPPALETWQRAHREGRQPWRELFDPAVFNESSVRARLEATGYPPDRLHFVRGPVEQTLPQHAPERLALLRLDTDWYESTRHELVHLFPRLQPGGVLIIDDYGHFDGARRAVDEYLAAAHQPLLLARIDYTARLAVKS